MKLRREGRMEEAEAESELAKALEAQLEEHDSQNTSKSEAMDDVVVEDLLDPQLLSALKAIGLLGTEVVAPRHQEKSEPAKASPEKGENLSQERSLLEEKIKAEKDLEQQNIQIQERNSKIQALQDQNAKLEDEVASLLKLDQDQKTLIQEYGSTIKALQSENMMLSEKYEIEKVQNTQLRNQVAGLLKLEIDQKKPIQDEVSSPSPKGLVNETASRNFQSEGNPTDVKPVPSLAEKTNSRVAQVKAAAAALKKFDPEQYNSLTTLADGANVVLDLVYDVVSEGEASRVHEIRNSVFAFIRKMEPKGVMNTMLVYLV
ncbi:hypothetical protein MKW98_023715 [Papaver atlanticum]|uniref:Uncharacterized protein n=1 Tax=Papaver atlanticum TaxID=357466 RepID=A0AAD4XMK4_9MAGN|nr:hypothetical protein MKW98_023715 [Papaver atlanticum]